MKRTICIVLSLILTVLSLASCTMDDVEYIKNSAQQQIGEQTDTPTDENTKELSNYEKIVAVAEPAGEHYSLERLDQKEIFSDFSEENLKEIMKAFDVIIDKNQVIKMKRSEFIKELFNGRVQYNYSEEDVFVSTQIDRKLLKYAMYVSVFIENFPDNTCYSVSDAARDYYQRLNIAFHFPYHVMVSFAQDVGKSLTGIVHIQNGEMVYEAPNEETYGFYSDDIKLVKARLNTTSIITGSGIIYQKNLLGFLKDPKKG